MALIKAKQLDIESVAASLTAEFTSNTTSRNTFVNSIKNAPGFDEKVKASSDDTDPSNYLLDKLEVDGDSTITVTPSFNTSTNKVKLSGEVNLSTLIPLIVAELKIIQFESNGPLPIYQDNNLINKVIFLVIREHAVLYEGINSDDYQFNLTTGEISFNTQVEEFERIRIFFG